MSIICFVVVIFCNCFRDFTDFAATVIITGMGGRKAQSGEGG